MNRLSTLFFLLAEMLTVVSRCTDVYVRKSLPIYGDISNACTLWTILLTLCDDMLSAISANACFSVRQAQANACHTGLLLPLATTTRFIHLKLHIHHVRPANN